MSASSSSENPIISSNCDSDPETDVDGDLGSDQGAIPDGAEEAFEILRPFILSPEQCPDLKNRLQQLGVTNLSHIPMLQEADFENIISPMQFRTMLKQHNANAKPSSSSNNDSSGESSSRYKLDLKSLLTKSFFQILKADDEILSKQDRSKLVVLIADDMRENLCVIRYKEIQRVSQSIIRAHPTSLGCLMKDEADILEAASSLSTSISNHIYYRKSLNKSKKRSASTDQPSKRVSFTSAQSNGLDPAKDLPNSLPNGETTETQETKRLLMVQWEKGGESINMPAVRKFMKETYFSQRADINDCMGMEKLLARWPYIGKHNVLQDHFETLKGVSVADAFASVETLFPNLEKFFEAEAMRKRKGKCAAIPPTLKALLKAYNEGEENSSKHLITIVMCCSVYMGVPENALFIRFEETTSFDEVQAYDELPSHPVIAVLGDNIQDNPKAYILVDKRIISEFQITVSKSLMALMMCYYVFKIAYPTQCAPILHFMQRKVFGIVDEGTKTQRTRTPKGYVGAPPAIPNQFLTLMKNFKSYCSEWNLEC